MEAHSSSFPTSQAAAASHHEKNMKMKEKVVENESPPKLNIDLNKTPSEFEHNLLNSQSVGSSSSDESLPKLSKTYDCIYCVKKFPTPQALAGHHNMHKHSRAMARRRANPSNPLYRSTLNRSIGVRMDSMVNKPTSMQSFASPSSFGHHGNMLQRMREAYNRLRMGILQEQTRAREFVRVFPSLTNLNAANNGANAGGRFRVFPPPATNVSAANNRDNLEDPSGLDLTLKL